MKCKRTKVWWISLFNLSSTGHCKRGHVELSSNSGLDNTRNQDHRYSVCVPTYPGPTFTWPFFRRVRFRRSTLQADQRTKAHMRNRRLDQQVMWSLYTGLDELRLESYELNTEPAAGDMCTTSNFGLLPRKGRIHQGHTQQRHLFADQTMYHLCSKPTAEHGC